METAAKKAGAQGVNAKANGAVNKVENRPNLTGKEVKKGGNTENQQSAGNALIKAATEKAVKTNTPAAMDNKPAHTENQTSTQKVAEKPNNSAKKEGGKSEIKYIKPALNLEQTLKSVESLNRLRIQRLALIGRIKQLEDFEVNLSEEGDELSSNLYEGCKLIIQDDKHRQFITVTPGLISMVADFIFNACHEKLAEIEAHIVFPNS